MIRRNRQGAVNVISATDPIIGENVDSLSAVLRECMQDGIPRAVLDLRDIPLINSLALEMLLDIQEEFTRSAGVLKLAGPNALCWDAICVTGINSYFETHSDVKSAVGSFVV
jgi:anti-anti-sigma factor